jgi:hypothetical protein
MQDHYCLDKESWKRGKSNGRARGKRRDDKEEI